MTATGTLHGADSLRLGAMAGYGNAQQIALGGERLSVARSGCTAQRHLRHGSRTRRRARVYRQHAELRLVRQQHQGRGHRRESQVEASASLAGGYSAEVATLSESTGFWLRPQAMLNWQGVKGDDLTEGNGTRTR